MFDRSAIMKSAWASYKQVNAGRKFDRSDFAFRLACAWGRARAAAETPAQRRVNALKAELAGLSYKSFRINTAARETAIKAELAQYATA